MADIIIKASDADIRKALAEQKERQNESMFNSALVNARRTGETIGSLEHIQWPEDPYGYDHAKQVQHLSCHILEEFPDMKDRDFYIMRVVGLFHDLGRQQPWFKEDKDHNIRSAELAAKYMREDPSWWSQKDLHAEICHLIASHSLRPEKSNKWRCPQDPRLISLHDAECLESARFAPKTPEGLTIMKRRMGEVITQWAKNEEHQRRWRVLRGW